MKLVHPPASRSSSSGLRSASGIGWLSHFASVVRRLLWVIALLCAAGCGVAPEDVAPQDAEVKLSNPRVEREFGEDILLVDYEFTHGLPERGWLYRMVYVSSGGEEYHTNHYFNETQTSGTVDGKLSFLQARDDPSPTFNAHMEVLIGTGSEYKSLSNTVTFEMPAGR